MSRVSSYAGVSVTSKTIPWIVRRPKGPNTVTGLDFQVGRNGVGEGPAGCQWGVDGDFSEWHSQWSRPLAPPYRNE